jgi:hypothetical protein
MARFLREVGDHSIGSSPAGKETRAYSRNRLNAPLKRLRVAHEPVKDRRDARCWSPKFRR